MKNKTYPIQYFYRGGESDLKFILQRMREIPDELKHDVSEEYERICGVDDFARRKKANIWLNTEALKYRNATSVKEEVLERVNVEVNAPKSNQAALKAKVDAIVPPKRKSFLGGLMDEVDKKHSKEKRVRE